MTPFRGELDNRKQDQEALLAWLFEGMLKDRSKLQRN